MENKANDSVRARLEKLRILRENEIPVQQQKMESFADSFYKSVESISVRSRANALSQGELSIFFNLLGKDMGVKLVTVVTYDTVIGIRMVCEVTIRVLKWVAIKTQNGCNSRELSWSWFRSGKVYFEISCFIFYLFVDVYFLNSQANWGN